MIEGEEQYEVEAVRAHRHHRRKLQYLIKWKGYPESDNTWEPVDNVQAPLLIRKYHEVHPLEDKRPAEQARKTSTPTSTVQPIWLLDNDHQSTFGDATAAAAALAATVAATTTRPALGKPPQNPNAYLASLLDRSFATLPSIPHINSSSSTRAHYPITVPSFETTPLSSHSPLSATPPTHTPSNTSAFARIATALLTDKCLTALTPPMKNAKHHHTPPASRRPQSLEKASPPRRSQRLQQLPPSHSPSLLTTSRIARSLSLRASSTLSGPNTQRSLRHWLKPSLPSIQCSMPPSAPQPLGLPPLYVSEWPTTLRNLPTPSSASSSSNDSISSTKQTTGSCELEWASSAFPMALSVMRDESPPESLQREAKWWSQNGSDQSGMGRWNYWPGGSLGNPPTSQNSSSVLTILRPLRTPQLHGSSPSSSAVMEVSTPSSKRPNALTTQQQLQKYIDTAVSMRNESSSPLSSIASRTPSPPPGTTLTHVDIAWSGPNCPSFYDTSRTEMPSHPLSLSLEDAIKTLVEYVSMAEHLPSGREVSPPGPGTNWADWSNTMGKEMYLRRALEKLNLEYPPTSDN
jgi:hypothetical protein